MPAPAGPAGRPRLHLHEKVLSLEFHVLDAQFNEPGRYQLVVSVENPLLDGSVDGVTLRVNHGDMINSNQTESDIAEQEDLTDTLTFQKNTYLFVLPRGLCKNDKHHDVRLCIDVLKYSTDSVKGRKVGQALFAIYPRPNQPRINLRAAQYEPLYNYHGVLALLRVGGDKLAMHCGRLAYNVCFREYQPPKHEDTPRESSSRPATFRTNVSQADTLMPIPDQPTSNYQASQRLTDLQIITSESGTQRSSSNQPNTSKPSTPPVTSYAADQKHVYDTHDLKSSQMMEEQVRTPSPESDALQEQDEHSTGLDIPPPPSPLPQRSRKMEDDAPLILPSPPVTPSLTQRTKVLEQPPEQSTPQYGADLGFKLLSPSGTETVSVTLHAAAHLPPTAAGSVPSPFITLKSGTDEKNNVRAQSISHATQSPTHNPAWGETLTITIREEDAEHEDLLLTVADSPSQDALLTYRLPIKDLVPFHTYHLSMVQPHRLVSSGCHLYTSIVRRKSHFTQQRGFTYSALQVLLGGVEVPLQNPTRPLIAVARIVPDYTNNSQSQKPPGVCGVSPVTVMFPETSVSSFEIPSTATQGHPQISPPGLPPLQPVWNTSFLFQGRDGVTLFSEGAALVLEYYPLTADSEKIPWNLSDYCGFSVVPLDTEVYHQLVENIDNQGYTMKSVTVQGTDLRAATGDFPTVSLQLLLLRSEHPELFLSPLKERNLNEWGPQNDQTPKLRQSFIDTSHKEESESFPLKEKAHNGSGPHRDQTITPRHGFIGTAHKKEILINGHSLPPHNAVADILPDPRGQKMQRDQNMADPEVLRTNPPADSFKYISNDLELPADPVMAHQEQELANYRLAMQRMADDIITLRRQLGSLEAENSTLRSERSLHQDLGRSLLSDTDLDVMTKAELADRLVTLKQKLAAETSELRGLRDRIHQLQNELVRKNDREKELLLLQRAHQQQQTVLCQYHERLSRAKTLQDTVRKQEKVIEKMEKLLDNKLREEKKIRSDRGQKGSQTESLQGEIHAALLAENSRLREELEKSRQPAITLPPIPQNTFSDSEKFSLLSKLEKSQARVQSLERELEEAARHWGREKQQLLTCLSEQEMGFSRTHTTILHHVPTKESNLPTRRHAKLDPLI